MKYRITENLCTADCRASKKKGLSLDEKRNRMLELFYDSKEFFQMKELERIAPKQKGVISQSVKEVTQSLVDDGLVECEKIGTFVCYWAFPAKALHLRKQKLDDLTNKANDLMSKIDHGRQLLLEAKFGKEDSEERTVLLADVTQLRAREAELTKQLEMYAKYEPAVIKQVRQRTLSLKEDANRWVDNIFAIKKWCKNKFGMDTKAMDKQFEIPEDMDYID